MMKKPKGLSGRKDKDKKDGGNTESNTAKVTSQLQSATNIAEESTAGPKEEETPSLCPASQSQPTTNLAKQLTASIAEKLTVDLKEEKKVSLPPIDGLWNEAYNELRSNEDRLIRDYEKILAAENKHSSGLTEHLDETTLLKLILEKKKVEVDENAWKLQIGDGKDIALKDFAAPVLSTIAVFNDYIGTALSSNPYASIAWVGISILLPLFLNLSAQADSLAKCLEYISNLIVRSSISQEVYHLKFESCQNDTDVEYTVFSAFRSCLRELYQHILRFQISTICYYSDHGCFRLAKDSVKWDDWNSLLQKIKDQEKAFLCISVAFKDELEERWHRHDQRHKESVENLINSINNNLSGLRRDIELANKNTQRTQLLQWLSNVDPSENYNNARGRCKDQTGNWLIKENLKFQKWKNQPNSFLWLHGKAGAGKTILSSTVIEYIKDLYGKNPRIGLGFFYFSFNDDEKQNVSAMLSSLVKQLYSQLPDMPNIVYTLIQEKEKGHRPDLKNLEQIFRTIVQGFSEVYIVIDALDECSINNERRRALLESLYRIESMNLENLHLLCTSRQEPDIKAAFSLLLPQLSNIQSGGLMESESLKDHIDLTLHMHTVNADIGLFVNEELKSKVYDWPPDLKNEARTTLIKKADGMFQYVAYQFEELRKCDTAASIQAALKNLPDGLDATYDRILLNLPIKHYTSIWSLLNWLAFSFRPLWQDELAEASAVDKCQSGPFDKKQRLLSADVVLKYLGGLVTTTQIRVFDGESIRYGSDQIEIRFSHFSIQEYLTSERIRHRESKPFFISYESAHLHLAESCFAYHQQISQTILVSNKLDLENYPLWEYAAQNWGAHTEKAGTISIIEKWTQVLLSDSQSFLNLVRIWHRDGPGKHFQLKQNDLPSPLCYVVSLGLYRTASHLIDNGAEINYIPSAANWNGPALLVAIYFGYEDIVKLLIRKGANVNIHSGMYGNALKTARNVNAGCEGYWNALQTVPYINEIGMRQFLLENGAETTVQEAIFDGDIDIVQLLLEKGAEVNAKEDRYGNALQVAVYTGQIDIVQLLLEKGAEVNAKEGRYGNALQAAVYEGYINIVQLLLEKGAEINAEGGEYGNALVTAIVKGEYEIAELLVLHRAKSELKEDLEKKVRENIESYYGEEELVKLDQSRENLESFMAKWKREREEKQRKRGKLRNRTKTQEWKPNPKLQRHPTPNPYTIFNLSLMKEINQEK